MSDTAPNQVVGITPWLPWPLSAWGWWSDPVRAERLAALRIGVGLTLFYDICYNYGPDFVAFYGKDGIGDPAHHNWYFVAHRSNWSFLRGVGHEAGLYLALCTCIALTLWIVGNGIARLAFKKDPPPDDRTGVALPLWAFTFAWYIMGIWSHLLADGKVEALAWVLPLGGFSLTCLFFSLDLAQRLLRADHRIGWWSAAFAFGVTIALFTGGLLLANNPEIDPNAWWARMLKPWPLDEMLLTIAFGAWMGSAFLLMTGFCTRWVAIAAWMLSMSFGNANSYLDNAGDTIRVILLFHLMLCPSGSAWSFDAMVARRQGLVFVHPWPLRLIFVQMVFIYFMNGLYKICAADWRAGMSLHYVLSDVTYTRFSYRMLPIPFWMTQIMTWTVLAWELTFPLLMISRWTRPIALLFGVAFHLGIFALMELGGFPFYALCMYLPLLPWERLSRR